MEILQALHPAALIAIVALFGLLVGSFLNVVILRFPRRLFWDWRSQCRELLAADGQSPGVPGAADAGPAAVEAEPPGLVVTRSHCPDCKKTIAWYDNIPVASWLILKGRCRHCGKPISSRYPVVELVTAILSVTVIATLGPTVQGLAALIFTWMLIAASGIDFDHQLLPDQFTLPLLWLGLILNIFGIFTDLYSAVIGAVVGYMALWLVFQTFKLLTGKEGMGFGDFKLLAAIGAWFGWQILPLVILLASLLGAVIGVMLMLLKDRGREIPIAFGPYLALGGWVAMLWGESMLEIYWGGGF